MINLMQGRWFIVATLNLKNFNHKN